MAEPGRPAPRPAGSGPRDANRGARPGGAAEPEQGGRERGAAEPAGGPPSRRSGPGRLLIAVYGVFALAAGARAAVQIATRFHEAPVAYLLSAFSAAVYVLATVTLSRSGRTSHRIAVASCTVELVGVLAVGTYSLTDRAAFPDATVWSLYGSGYGFVPLVLPVLGLAWLRRTAAR